MRSAESEPLRRARVGEILPDRLLRRSRARRIEASAVVVPGSPDLGRYLGALEQARADLAAWDGRLVVTDAGDAPIHRVLIVDRYGQVYETVDAAHAGNLPGPEALEEWFRFLATACPERGVLDDPVGRGWTP